MKPAQAELVSRLHDLQVAVSDAMYDLYHDQQPDMDAVKSAYAELTGLEPGKEPE